MAVCRDLLRRNATVGSFARDLHACVPGFKPPREPGRRHPAFQGIRLFDGFSNTDANYRGELPGIFAGAGLAGARETASLRTPLGTLALYSAYVETT